MPHIKNIIDTDCYIEFDNATELRLFAERNEIPLEWLVCNDDKYIRLFSDGREAYPSSANLHGDELPVHHYNNITEWVKPPYEKLDDDYHQDYIDSQL